MNPNFMERVTLVTADYGSDGKAVNLSKSRLGDFMYHLLRHGGNVLDVYVMNRTYDRSYVQMVVQIHPDNVKPFETDSGFILETPHKPKINNFGGT
jgi:hypothetical protein